MSGDLRSVFVGSDSPNIQNDSSYYMMDRSESCERGFHNGLNIWFATSGSYPEGTSPH